MANVTQLKHLEHLEDEMLNYGSEGCAASVSFLEELAKMLGHKSTATGFLQTKWDGAPSVVCGTDPSTSVFFVGTKSVFNKIDPKLCASDDAIDRWYGDKPNLAKGLKFALKYFKQLDIKGVVQGDLMYTDSTRKEEVVNGEKLYTFTPNTITYGIPVDHPIGVEVGQSKVGVVFHTHYVGDNLADAQAKAGADVKTFNKVKEVAVIENDTNINDVTLTAQEVVKFERHIKIIATLCGNCGEFLDNIVEKTGTTGDANWHVASYLKQFFNAEIREGRSIGNARVTLDKLIEFYHGKMKKKLAAIKTPKTLAVKRQLVFQSEEYLDENVSKFTDLLNLYREMQITKQFIIDKLDHLEKFRTFVREDKGYKVTSPEGYVLHQDGNMIKLVNRLEFSYNNFTVAKQWR
tara:strand:+ start:3596 stop:4810 length:1215 start_codon:yes stop_codon:yes gene_type:complete